MPAAEAAALVRRARIVVDRWEREDLRRLFAQARKLSGETDYVVLGSLSALGQGSTFEADHGYYLDPISPHVATLPAGWGERLA